ncbi:hypothetical protein C8J56DRAFT_48893 [Mycena floridula]|nr:hypothetical protein C8J56DRAFT_111840 [Mycena floridula]KAJ7588575.1 hypothetical protein C8J56DRAFT_48893 [Mycena floridula]
MGKLSGPHVAYLLTFRQTLAAWICIFIFIIIEHLFPRTFSGSTGGCIANYRIRRVSTVAGLTCTYTCISLVFVCTFWCPPSLSIAYSDSS